MRKLTKFYRGHAQQYEQADYWEKKVVLEILSLTPENNREKITFDFKGGAGTSEKFNKSPFNPAHPWDIEFSYEGKIFTYVDPQSRPRLNSFYQYSSQFVRTYKVEALPDIKNCVFFVCVIPKAEELKRYHWTTREKAKPYPKKGRDTWIPELQKTEWQENYEVGTEAWECGIESLVETMLGLLHPDKHSIQKTLMRKIKKH